MKKTNIMDLEWDNMIIIDACRYDVFEELNDIPGKSDYIWSLGSCTGEWVRKTFTKEYPDVLYITANPHVSFALMPKILNKEVPFKDIIEVWDDYWDEKLETVKAEEMNRIVEKHLNYKGRKILHYMQPHHPFIGKVPIAVEGKIAGYTQWKENRIDGKTVWKMLAEGSVTRENAWDSYKSNLEYVLEEIKKILPKLKGKTIISSDHGNMFGEKDKIYGHPCNLEHEELLKVPYFEVK